MLMSLLPPHIPSLPIPSHHPSLLPPSFIQPMHISVQTANIALRHTLLIPQLLPRRFPFHPLLSSPREVWFAPSQESDGADEGEEEDGEDGREGNGA